MVLFRTTGPGRYPLVPLWEVVLLSWGPVLLQDPSRPVLCRMDRNHRRPSEEDDLQRREKRGSSVVRKSENCSKI